MITNSAKIREKTQDSPCSPAIWRKFNPREQDLWMNFYSVFLNPTNFAVGWDGNDEVNKSLQEVTAHNMACRAVWALQEAEIL